MKCCVTFSLRPRTLERAPQRRLLHETSRALGIGEEEITSFSIHKCSIDARKKPDVRLLFTVIAEFPDALQNRIRFHEELPPVKEEWHVPERKKDFPLSPVVVGSGPSGLFAALVLAEAGAKPVILERGRDVSRRKEDIDLFFQTRTLNPESNILFGEGGAGTWSDGKLFTRIRDVRSDYVMRAFVQAGAGPEILYLAHPHIGSDRLPGIVKNIRERIIALGGEFHWDSMVKDAEIASGSFRSLLLADGSRIESPAAIIGCGHSARDLILCMSRKVPCAMKGFQIGCRIEHEQRFINRVRYGVDDPSPVLGAAEYLFSARPSGTNPGATTFCMCPGGEIIPAVCEEGRLCTNGMSRSARDGRFANSAIVSGIPDNLFSTPAEAYAFLEKLEESMFRAGGGDFSFPVQGAAGFLRREESIPRRTSSAVLGVTSARLDVLLPDFTAKAIRNALLHFEKLVPGFIASGMLFGMETRVSSPVRFLRDPETMASSSVPNLYLCGEGSGMAGGIVSAAVDGVRAAEALLLRG